MIQPEYFLDTCIYVGYAVEFDVYNDKCKKLCDGNYPKNTSYTVKNEIDEIIRDYRKFQKALNSNGYDLDAIIKTQTNPNRIQFLEQLKEQAIKRTKTKEEFLSQIRLLLMIVIQGISAAFAKTKIPLQPISNDQILITSLYIIRNRLDAQILADAAEWSKSLQGNAIFCTKDSLDIVLNARLIERIIRRNDGDCQLTIMHIRDF